VISTASQKFIILIEAIVAHWYDADTLTASPNQINFLIFVPLFSFLSILYLEIAPRFVPRGTYFAPSFSFTSDKSSVTPVRTPRSRGSKHPLLLRRLCRTRNLLEQAPLLPGLRVRRRSR